MARPTFVLVLRAPICVMVSVTQRLAVALACLATAASLKPSMRRAPARNDVAVAKKLSTTLATAALSLSLSPLASLAFGPETIELTNMRYEDTNKKVGEICAGRPLKPPGEKVAAGLLPKCVAVTATASSKSKKDVKDAAVYGYVKTATGDSAIANNPDFRSDAGQFAMIPKVPPGSTDVAFEFVAVIPDSKGDLGSLVFEGLKAVSYPGGARMATFTACEMDSLSDACDGEQEKFLSK